MVEVRNAALDGSSHRGTIEHGQELIGKVRDRVGVELLIERMDASV
jgi:hypothetical protein